jgi:hypothetical protein
MFEVGHAGFEEANNRLMGVILSILANHMCDVYMHITNEKEL